MKSLKFLTAGALALTLVGTASAQTVIRITGSSAFRAATHNAIRNIMPDEQFGYTGTSFTGASQAIFVGTVAGNSVIIKTAWSGSVGGIQTVSGGLNVNFLANNATVSGSGTPSLATGTSAEVPQIAMSDVFQASTRFTANELFDRQVGVVPFKWVASYGAPAGLSNVTPQLASAVFLAGQLPLSLFTGVAADVSTPVFATGRDFDSGTRLTAVAETGIGVASVLFQYQPTLNTTSKLVTGQIPWPEGSINGIDWVAGDGGYNSGGTLAGAMRYQSTGAGTIGGYYITYLGINDAATATAAPTGSTVGQGAAKELSYNGVFYSVTAVQEGQYTFWGYEHLMYDADIVTPGSVLESVATLLGNNIETATATDSGISLSSMKVSRQTDGGQVGAN
jgi:hypothetical protein